MSNNSPGYVIEAFVVNAKSRVFRTHVDRHHPEVMWATADASGNSKNFPEIKSGVLRSLEALKYTLYGEGTHDHLLGELDNLTDRLKDSQDPEGLAMAISEAEPTLVRAFKM